MFDIAAVAPRVQYHFDASDRHQHAQVALPARGQRRLGRATWWKRHASARPCPNAGTGGARRRSNRGLSVRSADEPVWGPSTLGVWAGEERPLALGATQPPIFLSAPFCFPDVESWLSVAHGRAPGHSYSRSSNPTVGVFEEKLRWLEGGEAAASFASGMAAISNSLLALLRPGDRVVALKDCYGGTSQFFLHYLAPLGITVDLIGAASDTEIETAIRRGCRLVYLESPTNPLLRIVDLRRAAAAARAAGAWVLVDNTLATPVLQKPLALGADLVVHSATKFIGGHDDAMGGIVVGRSELVAKIFAYREITGAALNPFAAYLLIRGLKTLGLRVERQSANALAVATLLAGDARVTSVNYPGLHSDLGHRRAVDQMQGFGGVLSFRFEAGLAAAKRFLDALQLAHRAASLGSVNSLAGLASTTSHLECSEEERAMLGIPADLVRLSCGIEDTADLTRDVLRAIECAHGSSDAGGLQQ